MRVLVCGGRDYENREAVYRTLDAIHADSPVMFLIHGDCGRRRKGKTFGADWLAKEWAISRRALPWPFPADWDLHGKAAGPIRNQQMIDEGLPDLCVAFPGGRGTADMVRRAKAAGVRVVEVKGE